MITTLEQDIKKGKLDLLKCDLKRKLIYKHQITEQPKHIWFKGSRYR